VGVVRATEWELALPTSELDPARFLGELSALPPVPRPGDWCTIVWAADDGELPLTLVARELVRTTSLLVDRLPAGQRARGPGRRNPGSERVAEREGLMADLHPLDAERAAARTD
jgi:hypothetical protein